MIAVGDIVLIGNAWDDTKTLLQAFGELVSSRFQWSTVNRIADVLGRFPFLTLVIQLLHDSKGKVMSFWCSMRVAGHAYTHLMKTGIAKRDGGITII